MGYPDSNARCEHGYALPCECLESDLHARVRELERETERLYEKEEELKELRGSETCAFCRVSQVDWTALLKHYDTCIEIQRTRLML